ncbi:hypothetical protein [Leptothoe kymatousa]|uniref:Lipoprotein n=1 Tax=Leptothoe kymatousa TAU-MAC 1615 TaxID=2364775 RepID=A0ABS5Y642_9CYAN|nr:hypothetical protein [Leptothoe kymatousa]MBT9313324.1 hypothetical protein [Leptothoe kymatousa TAU-MAC 1615]
MLNFYRSTVLWAKCRQLLSLSVLVCCLVLVSCTPQEECAAINGALADGNLQVQQIYEGNRGGSGYNQGIERQVGRVYYDISQVLDGLRLSNRALQNVQFRFVEAYQRASDYRYQAAELIAEAATLNPRVETQVRQLQLDSEANIGRVTTELRKHCPLR